jgi:heme/copper-type cytochrome/quinol oxidase subunit 2
MAKTNQDQSQQFNTMLLTAAIIAGILALCIVWMVYGCARETNHKPKLEKPGMYLISVR